MSEVWNYFVKSSTAFAKCKICQVDVPRKGNTTNLKVHLQKYPDKEKALECVLSKNKCEASCSGGTKALEHLFKESELWTGMQI